MSVNRDQVSAMGDIIARMNALGADAFGPGSGALPPAAPAAPMITESGFVADGSPSYRASVDDGQTKAMGDILKRFRMATSDLREEAQTNDALLEALQTERTSTGVRIAEWRIDIREEQGVPGKFYDVTREDIRIASDLRLYEAALMLTRELNEGASITSEKVRKVLALEAQYSKNFEDAINYSRLVKATTGSKQEIASHRLDEAKAKAIEAKKKINEIR